MSETKTVMVWRDRNLLKVAIGTRTHLEIKRKLLGVSEEDVSWHPIEQLETIKANIKASGGKRIS